MGAASADRNAIKDEWSAALSQLTTDLRGVTLRPNTQVLVDKGKVFHHTTCLGNSQALFQEKNSIDGCNTIMSYLELCRVGELNSTADASPLAFEAYMELLEPVVSLLAVYVTPSKGGQPVFLTTPLMDILLNSPVLAQHTNRCSIANLRYGVQKDVLKVADLSSRVAAVLYSLTKELSPSAVPRTSLLNAVQAHAHPEGQHDAVASEWEVQQRQLAARLSVLAATLAVVLATTDNARIPGLSTFRSRRCFCWQ